MKPAIPAWAAPALVALFVLAVVTASASKSATFDESVHIFSGWRVLTQGDYATNHEHPPLMKMLAAAPLALMSLRPPGSEMRKEVDEWSVSHDFVYHANDGDRILAAARFPIALTAALLAWCLYRWAAAALGATAALVALALLVTEPNLLAHAGLVTTDMGMTATTFLTVAAFTRWLRTRSSAWMAAAGVSLGLAFLAKFTAVLLAPILILIGGAAVLLERQVSWRQLAAALAAIAGIALLVLNLGYGFGGTFSTLQSFAPESEAFRQRAAGPLGRLPLPVPIEYVRGFDHAEAGGQQWWAYLFGEHSMTGWRHYYLAALAVKTPLQLLVLAAAGLVLWPRVVGGDRTARAAGVSAAPGRVSRLDAAAILIPIAVWLAAFTFSGNLKNIGLRYILPVYPFLCLLAALAARALLEWTPAPAAKGRSSRKPGWGAWIVGGLVVWQALTAAWIYPDFLTFFNLTVGGPSRGSEVLLDSNLDWGQDLKGLGRYIKEKRIDRIYVDYFGRACLKYYGVTSTPDFEGGAIAVSATNLKGVYSDDKDRYRFLWSRPPVAVIGGSIFVYDAPRPDGWRPKPGALEGR